MIIRNSKLVQFVILLIIFFSLYFGIEAADDNILWRFPALIAGLPGAINVFVEHLMYDWMPIQIYDPELDDYEDSALIKEITRSFSRAVLFFIELIRELLLGGVKTIVAFTSWDFVGENGWAVWPALPWTFVAGGAAFLGYTLKGKGLAFLAGSSAAYIAIFGQWEPAMETLSFVLVAAPVSCFLGLVFGVLCFKSRSIEIVMMPLLNIAQTMPHFSYLVPVMVFFGVGDHAGAIATIIFATPPMIRLTLLGLKSVPPEVFEAGMMSGCNDYQILFVYNRYPCLVDHQKYQCLVYGLLL